MLDGVHTNIEVLIVVYILPCGGHGIDGGVNGICPISGGGHGIDDGGGGIELYCVGFGIFVGGGGIATFWFSIPSQFT